MKRYILLILPLFLYSSEATVEQLFNITTTKVKKTEKSLTKSFYGTVMFDEKKIVQITPRFDGFIEKLYANQKFQYVKKGEVLAKVYAPEVYKTKQEYQNSINYKNKGMIEALKTKLLLLEVEPKSVKKTPSPFIMIRAKTDGYIISSSAFEGGGFKKLKPLFIIAPASFKMEAKIPQEFLSKIKEFKKFEVFISSLNKTYKATNPTIYPSIDKQSSLVTLRVDINSSKMLIDGLYANLFTYKKLQNYLLIPKTAVIRKDGKWYAFKKGEYEGEWKPTQLDITPFDGNSYIVKSGLKDGDEVANKAMFLLDSDAQVNGMYP